MSEPITVGEVLAAMEGFAPGGRAAAWDRVGLQVGDPASPVGSAAVCHEITEEVVAEAVAAGIDLLVSYHPLLFHPVTRLVAGRHAAGRALRLAGAGVAVVVAHSNADVTGGGVADALADAFELEDAAGFGPAWPEKSVKVITFVPDEAADSVADAMGAAGAGRIGEYLGCSFRTSGVGTFLAPEHGAPAVGRAGKVNRVPEARLEMVAPAARVDAVVAALVAAHPYEEPAFDVVERKGETGFVGRVGRLPGVTTLAGLGREAAARLGGVVRLAGDPDRTVRRVAVVPGSGGDLGDAAADAGAEVLVTGDVSHHRARAVLDRGLAIVDPGHAATERPGVARLYAAVAAIVPDATELGAGDSDPWRSP